MRLSNASYAYFGLFLSQEMARLGHLQTLYTNLPFTRLRDLPPSKYRSQPLLAAPLVAHKLGLTRLGERIEPTVVRLFARWVASVLTDCDVFHCFSSFGLEAHRAARTRFGALTIVERGSSHIRTQNEILIEEHRRWGIPFTPISPWVIDRETAEYEFCDRVTVQSTFAERTFIEQGVDKRKLIKLPLGVDLRMFHPVPKRDDAFRVLYAGHCSVRKGIGYLLEAVAPLRLPNFELVINGSVHPTVQPLMAQHASAFRFLGFQPINRLHEVYSQASVLVLPTVEDGFAKVVTEAMACGVPVIATTNCGALDVLDDGVEGFIVPIRDPQAIREKVLCLYENAQLRDRMAQAALARSQKVTNLHVYGESAATAYQQALAAARS